jgi:hypothetical protein
LRVLRRIFFHTREEVVGSLEKTTYEEHHNLYASPDIIMVMKTRGLRWVGHIVHIGEMRCIQNFGQKT